MAQEQHAAALRPWHTAVFMVALIVAVTVRLVMVEGQTARNHVTTTTSSARP